MYRTFEDEYELIPELETAIASCAQARTATEPERQKIRAAIGSGQRNENVLSDMVFFDRHPELSKKPLYKGQSCFDTLSKEWLDIRDNMVRPALASPSGVMDSSSNCLVLDNFEFAKKNLIPQHITILQNFVKQIIANQNNSPLSTKLIITGHTDPTGGTEYNLNLGLERAKKVEAYIKALLQRTNPTFFPKIQFGVLTKGEDASQGISTNSAKRRVTVCSSKTETQRVNSFKVVAKSFIMRIGSNIGNLNTTLRCQLASTVEGFIPGVDSLVGLDPNTKLKLIAIKTDQMFSENPQNDIRNKDYRLFSSTSFIVKHDGKSIIDIKFSKPDTDVGIEPIAESIGIAFTPPALEIYSKPILTRLNATNYSFVWGFKGRPPNIAEPAFQIVCPRTSRYIWHEVRGYIRLQNGSPVVIARVLGSNFPSHKVFINNNTNSAMFKEQGSFSNLWIASPNDASLVKEFEI